MPEERPTTHTNNGGEQQPVDTETQQFTSNGGTSSIKNEGYNVLADGESSLKPRKEDFPSTMKYMQALAKWMKANGTPSPQPSFLAEYKKHYENALDWLAKYKKFNKEFLDAAAECFENAPDDFKRAFTSVNNKHPLWFYVPVEPKLLKCSHWSPFAGAIYIKKTANMTKVSFCEVLFHEIGHYMDNASIKHSFSYASYDSGLFGKAKAAFDPNVAEGIRNMFRRKPDGSTWSYSEVDDFYKGEVFESWGCLFDIIGSMQTVPGKCKVDFELPYSPYSPHSSVTVRSGHDDTYYSKSRFNAPTELLANFNAAFVCSAMAKKDPRFVDTLTKLEEMCPGITDECKKIYAKM